MSLLLDSTVFIDYARGHSRAKFYLNELQSRGVETFTSVIVKMELIGGCRNKREVRRIDELFSDCKVRVLPITTNISGRSLKLFEKFHHSHGLEIPDAFIAATALEHGLTLVTGNRRHFGMIKGLKLEEPY